MSKISDANKRDYADKKFNEARQSDKIVKNFMNGDSYTCDPLTTLKLVTASSIYGEPSYYRNSGMKAKDGVYHQDALVNKYSVFPQWTEGKTTTQIMEQAIDEALSYDFEATLNWAITLRNDFYMRLNPQVIMVRASQSTIEFEGGAIAVSETSLVSPMCPQIFEVYGTTKKYRQL